MELQQLKYFKTVAETGKISAAAEILFLSAPALSTSIARLEKELGMPLFHRTGNRILLNPQGELLLQRVNQVLHILDETKADLQKSLLPSGRTISLATVSSTQWIDLLAAFSQEFPEIALSCTSLKISQLSESGLPAQYTFLLAAEDTIPAHYAKDLSYKPLFQDHPGIVVHKSHPLAKQEYVELQELAGETLFLPLADYSLYEHLIKVFKESGIPFPSGNAYPHLVCQQMAAEKHGVTFAFSHTAIINLMELRYIPIKTDCPPWASCLYWRNSGELTPDARIFIDFVEAYYHRIP